MLGVPLLFRKFDDVDQFKSRVEPVADVVGFVRAVDDEGRRADEGCGDPVACVILPPEALERPPRSLFVAMTASIASE